MRILYIHITKLDTKMANCVQVISMCNEFSKQNEVFLLSPISNRSEIEMQLFLESAYNLSTSVKLLFFKKIFNYNRIEKYSIYFRLKPFIKDIKPNFCFIRDAMFLATCLKVRIPTFYEAHNASLHPRFIFLDYLLRLKLIILSRNKFLIKVITISKALENKLIKYRLPKTKVLTLHDGFDASMYMHPISQSKARKINKLPNNIKIALYTGSLYRDRKIENILFLAEQNKSVFFLVIGGPQNQKEYYEMLSCKKKLNNIKFLGHIAHKEIPNYLYSANILLGLWSSEVNTINYCSPLKIFEYMASGRLILAHSFPTIKEVLTDSENAFLAIPDSQTHLNQKFKEAIIDRNSTSKINKARKDAFNKYAWAVRTNTIIKEFNYFSKTS